MRQFLSSNLGLCAAVGRRKLVGMFGIFPAVREKASGLDGIIPPLNAESFG
jgi:hypothetical protein